MVIRNFCGNNFFSVGPPAVGNGNVVVFGLFWAWDTQRDSRPGPKTEKHNFTVLGALLGGKSGGPNNFSPKLGNIFAIFVLTDWTPRDGKS